ncbi:MAG TPA: phosphoribosylglycinamide formyltransferase [Woeseiaceae bacterium]|nr:phosphoribosylglycinamide formyltransferase [Woeseiaceae bacterium]
MTGAACSAAVLVSGGGTNLQAFIDAVRGGRLDLTLCAVVSDNPDAKGLARARRAGLPAECVPRAEHAGAPPFEDALAERLARYRPDLLILAGFMRILSGGFVARYEGRILNIHPSLLPRFRGLNTHQRALDAGDRWHGCTVHFVTEQLDGGPRIAQARVPVLPDDTAPRLAARVLEMEHRIYPWAAGLVASGRVRYRDGAAWHDGEPLREPLLFEL